MKLSKDFYYDKDVVKLSQKLLGKVLFVRTNRITTAGIITETEAYAGFNDRASHAYNGRRTPRNEIMYADGGTAYVYLCYGIHSLFNVVTNEKDIPHAILVRAVYPVEGIKHIAKRRLRDDPAKMATGPGSVSEALGIRLEDNGVELTGSKIWIEEQGISFPKKNILSGPRIGVESSGTSALLPYRFWVKHAELKTMGI